MNYAGILYIYHVSVQSCTRFSRSPNVCAGIAIYLILKRCIICAISGLHRTFVHLCAENRFTFGDRRCLQIVRLEFVNIAMNDCVQTYGKVFFLQFLYNNVNNSITKLEQSRMEMNKLDSYKYISQNKKRVFKY